MACYSPLEAWQTEGGDIVFSERGKIRRALTLPCGQCIGCKLERSRQWAVRIMHEASLHERSSFVTLTYKDAPMSLEYSHFQKFMKRLRKKVGPVRFFMCGEYGEQNWRPHFHACLFGVAFQDRYPWRMSGSGFQLYRSPLLESIWDLGSAEVGELSFESAQYVAAYCMKKVTGDRAEAHYCKTDYRTGEIVQLVPEFAHMSLKPGIGAEWLTKYVADVYPGDFVVVNGVRAKPPRFYDKCLSVLDSDTADYLEFTRYEKSFKSSIDSTVDRLRAREIVTRARLSFKVRNLE